MSDLEKSLEQLKADRTTAKRSFTRRVNSVLRSYKDMTEEMLKDTFDKLTSEAENVMAANEDLEAALLLELELATVKEESLTQQQQDDLEKTANECQKKLNEVKSLIQSTLWENFGIIEVSTAVKAAEAECEFAADVQPDTKQEAYEFILSHLKDLMMTAMEVYRRWKRWIPPEEQRDLQSHLQKLELHIPRLVSRKADFIQTRTEGHTGRQSLADAIPNYLVPAIKLKPTSLPKFSGNKRDFHRWKKDWEALQQQGEPTGSKEVKKVQLLSSIEDKIIRELRLTMYNTAEDIFRMLANRFGNETSIAIEIVEELQRLPAVKSHQPRKIVELIQTVEKALQDLNDLGNTGAIRNPLVTKSIESKLPEVLKKEWLVYAADNSVVPDKRFDSLLAFLKGQESIYEQLEQLQDEEPARKDIRPDLKYTRARSTNSYKPGCVVCGDGGHKRKLYFCKQFRTLKLSERQAAISKLGACRRCLEVHDNSQYCKPDYLCRNQSCKDGRTPDHHYYLCPKTEVKKNDVGQRGRGEHTVKDESMKNYTCEQEEFLKKLSPDLAKQCRDVFSNTASRALSTLKDQSNLLTRSGLQELPVIMMLLEVTANAGQKIGALIDLASDTNYITHKAAEKLNLRGEEITLVVHGVGGMKTQVETKRYLLKIRVKTPKGSFKSHQMICYGLKSIADILEHVSPERLKKFFPDVPLEEFVRPKEINLLISHREGQLAPQRVKAVGDLVLWDGPLGKVVGGAHPELFEECVFSAHMSKTHFARSMRTAALRYEELNTSMTKHASSSQDTALHKTNTSATSKYFLDWWRWDSIGAACEPKCGGCRCGNCQPGGKEMTLAEERELEVIRGGLTYIMKDSHSKEPHWHAKYPWIEDPTSLPNNKKGVQATFFRTEKQLDKEPEWKVAYAAQLHEMIDRGAAVRLSTDALSNWNGPVWYVSHLISLNPHSVTTPVRVVWNSSQRFEGVSLNELLMKGPDVLNQIRAVLLRFRDGKYAALGDVRKMYNSVWLEDREMHLHRFLWRESEEETLGEYAVTRVNMGDKPAGCIAQVAMRETAKLPAFAHLKEEQEVIQHDSYVDDILTSHKSLDQLKVITTNVKLILKAGGFELKPWIFSGQNGRTDHKENKEKSETNALILPNQMSDDENKALGLGYAVEEDKLYVMTAINFSKRKRKIRLGQDLLQEQIRTQTPNPLTRRVLLSQLSGLYDPVGLVTPAKQKGAMLVRRAFQQVKDGSNHLVKETWDVPLTEELREDAIKIFEEYAQLGRIKFPRALTPLSVCNDPVAITFSDGSEQTYGAVMYLRWSSEEGPIIRLVESKAKLTPLDQKGDVIKAEVCGAVFASRLKTFFELHSRIKAERWYHFVDSQTVLGAIQRESYGFQTFFANRIGEIQGSTKIQDWWWIPGSLNIADLITRGAKPHDLDEGSEWQEGPAFLRLPIHEWPIKSAKELASTARDSITKLQKKAFVAVLTRSGKQVGSTQDQSKIQSDLRRSPHRFSVQNLINLRQFSNLVGLVKTIACVWRAAKRFLRSKPGVDQSKWEAVPLKGIISVAERQDALRDIFLAAQQGMAIPSTTMDRLVVYRDQTSGLLICGGRVQSFNNDQLGVPILPYDAWVSTLLAREAHNKAHDGVAGTLLRMRKKAWVVRGRRLAQKIVDGCITCRKAKARACQQVMGDLPTERSGPAAPFEFTSIDLFGPYQVRDDIKRRVSMKVWGVVFCCMASRAIHVDIANSLSSESFLMTYQRFTAIRGHPKKIWSDPGTNFIGARPVLKELYQFLDSINKTGLEEYAAKKETEWVWKILPADSPHRNGAAEAAVRVVKRALQGIGKDSSLSYSEFQTTLQIAANLTNERPIGARTQSREDCIEYITPNSLLLGRASESGDCKTFNFPTYPYSRLRKMQDIVTQFWRNWSQLAGPNLFVRSKWHTFHRNVAVGDIVWLSDQNALKGHFKLGRVVGVNPDSKGIVRDAQVQVSPSYCTPIIKHVKRGQTQGRGKDFQPVVLHRDVRRLIVLLPVEEQTEH
ncbi:uncharacterized protein [Nothobranchius furzeri]|uniref:uncharacterized protein n=1 Tax=Nothobranchius furzeri TaxID=105023 RepID=UPI00390463A9